MLLVVGCLLLVSANVAFAQGLVPCSGLDCNLCHVLVLANNIVKLMIEVGIALAGLFFAWGAIVIMTAGGSAEKVTEGKNSIWIAVQGIVIMFAAYLLIETLVHTITGSASVLPWSEIQCNISK